MRLTKNFVSEKGVDRKINAWVRENPKQRVILQVTSHDHGVVVLYEKASRQEEWESVKRAFAKTPKNPRKTTA